MYRVASGLPVGPRLESLPQHGKICLLNRPWVSKEGVTGGQECGVAPGHSVSTTGIKAGVAWACYLWQGWVWPLGGLLAARAGGRTKTKQGYTWFHRRMELFLGLYLKHSQGSCYLGMGLFFQKALSLRTHWVSLHSPTWNPKVPQRVKFLAVDKLSNFCYWEKILMETPSATFWCNSTYKFLVGDDAHSECNR